MHPGACVTTQQARGKKHNTPNEHKRGPEEWARGSKLTFLDSRKSQWQEASDTSTVGKFYNRITILFLLKYGFELAFDEDLADDVPDPPNDAIDDHDLLNRNDLSEEEVTERNTIYLALRAVRLPFFSLNMIV